MKICTHREPGISIKEENLDIETEFQSTLLVGVNFIYSVFAY